MSRIEFIITEATGAFWPGILPYRSNETRVGRGYPTREQAEARARRVNDHYNENYGRGLDLRILEREVK